ncbi:MAG: hypothetical protein ACKVQJ_03415 [Pyrinomonadaceae bacterium]
MKVLLYILTTLFGLYGILAGLRFIEYLLASRVNAVQLGISLVALAIAVVCLKKARAS